jgi:hypothetical protein
MSIQIGPVECACMPVLADNGVRIGEIYCEVDGQFVMQFDPRPGYIPAHVLRAIADGLDRLNASWDAILQADPALGRDGR